MTRNQPLKFISKVGQNHIYTVYIRYFWQGNHRIYGHIRCIYTVLANPIYKQSNGTQAGKCPIPTELNLNKTGFGSQPGMLTCKQGALHRSNTQQGSKKRALHTSRVCTKYIRPGSSQSTCLTWRFSTT